MFSYYTFPMSNSVRLQCTIKGPGDQVRGPQSSFRLTRLASYILQGLLTYMVCPAVLVQLTDECSSHLASASAASPPNWGTMTPPLGR